jgi:thymidine kinase
MVNNGSLELIIGNMFSGKSTELIRRINSIKSINKKVLIINYIHDNRYSKDSVCSHDNIKIKSLKTDFLLLIDKELLLNSDFIFIDEGQFFSDLIEFVKLYVDFYKKNITISGLDGDSNRKKFGCILDLIPLCDSVLKLKAYCIKCCDGTYAPFTKKIINNDVLIDIGGSDKYIPVCRTHYYND